MQDKIINQGSDVNVIYNMPKKYKDRETISGRCCYVIKIPSFYLISIIINTPVACVCLAASPLFAISLLSEYIVTGNTKNTDYIIDNSIKVAAPLLHSIAYKWNIYNDIYK